MWFPIQTATAIVINGFWEIDFPLDNVGRVLKWVALQGPSGSSVTIYIGGIFVDTTPRGDINRADYYDGMPIAAGQQLSLIWNVQTGTAPKASIGCTDGDQSGIGYALGGQHGIFVNG